MEILKESEDDYSSCDAFLEFLLNAIERKSQIYNEESTYTNRVILQNYLHFFMIFTLNLKHYPVFIKTVFKGETLFFNKLINILMGLKNRKIFLDIIDNLFGDEYKEIFFRENKDEELEALYSQEKTFFREKYEYSEKKVKNEIERKSAYTQIFSKILKFDLNYSDFFPESDDNLNTDEKSAYKLTIVQGLIRLILSNGKKQYTSEKFFEFNTIKKVIDKDIEETIEKYGDEYKTLFRKEDICDDFLKYIFFIFGNKMMVESFANPIRKELYKLGFKNRDIQKDEFQSFMNIFISTLKETIPNILKIVLKLLYESVISHFTIEKDNYGPLYTTLIFNFFISPRVQSIFNINNQKNFVRSLNRILRNAVFNFKFSDADPLSVFNDIIEENHLKIKNFIEENIISIDLESEECKSSLEEIFDDEYFICPKFLIFSDLNCLCDSPKEGINKYFKAEEDHESNEWIVI